jgi:hypothetical protein
VIFNNSQENTETKQKKPEEFKKKEYTAANPKKFDLNLHFTHKFKVYIRGL